MEAGFFMQKTKKFINHLSLFKKHCSLFTKRLRRTWGTTPVFSKTSLILFNCRFRMII